MVLPRKADILQKAMAKDLERQFRHGIEPITPEESELKESGTFQEAKEDLMRDPAMVSEQLKYLSEMAGDLRLKVIPIKELRELKTETGYEWTNGWTKHEAKPKRVSLRKPLDITSAIRGAPTPKISLPKLPQPIFQLPKQKHRKRRIQRTGKTMRVLRKRIKDGQKSFSFPDWVWKVKR